MPAALVRRPPPVSSYKQLAQVCYELAPFVDYTEISHWHELSTMYKTGLTAKYQSRMPKKIRTDNIPRALTMQTALP